MMTVQTVHEDDDGRIVEGVDLAGVKANANPVFAMRSNPRVMGRSRANGARLAVERGEK